MTFILISFLSFFAHSADQSNLTWDQYKDRQATKEEKYFYDLNDRIKEAVKGKDCEDAEKFSNEALKVAEKYRKNWNYGNTIYDANMALGYCQFEKGDIEAAKASLLKAGKTPGSPQLNSFGLATTDMRLPVLLLERGQKQTVLDFLDLSTKFWEKKFSSKYIKKWKNEIGKGRIPDFNQNLD